MGVPNWFKKKKTSVKEQATDFDSIVQATYEAILISGDIAIDVGAHVGSHTIPMAKKVFPHGQILAFEPLPACREALANQLARHHPELQDLVIIYPYALSDYDGEAEFVVAVDSLAYSGLKERIYDIPTKLERMLVPVRKIDTLFPESFSLKYIKIDVEGGELHTLRGAVECIRKWRPLVAFEFGANSLSEYKVTPVDMAQFWAKQEYNIYDIMGNYLPSMKFVQSAIDQNIWDYIAVPAESQSLEKIIKEVLKNG